MNRLHKRTDKHNKQENRDELDDLLQVESVHGQVLLQIMYVNSERIKDKQKLFRIEGMY